MGRRKGPSLTTEALVDAAVQVVQQDGVDALGISRVARELGIKPASMYNHIESGDALARAVAHEGTGRLLAALKSDASNTLEPSEHFRRLVHGTRRWVRANASLYALMARVEPDYTDGIPPQDRDLLGLFALPLRRLGVAKKERVHALRSIRSAIHGFVLLESSGQFQLAEDAEQSFEWMVEALLRGMAPPTSISS